MIDSVSTKQPPLWPSVGALLLAGWIGGIVSTALWAPMLGAAGVGRVFGSPGVITATWLAPTLAGALVASAVLPHVLRAFCDFELGFGSAFVITLGRGLAGFAVGAFSALVVARGTALPSSATLFVLPEIASVAVGYQLLKRLAEPSRRPARPDLAAPSWLDENRSPPPLRPRRIGGGSSPVCEPRSRKPSRFSPTPSRKTSRRGWLS